ncbi:hypothetical protein BH20CHL5_BH20CHL5_00990 [soil metagenome]
MSPDTRALFDLLPAVYQLRDAELAGRVPSLLTPAEAAELAALEAAAGPLHASERGRLATLRAKRDQGPLKALLTVLGEQVAVLQEDLAQLYDDQFIETCAPWAVPYIGDLIGYRTLHGKAPRTASRRAEVAHTIAFRRRKGTASMLEQLSRDVTAWNAHVVEYFRLLATTQYMNHLRPANKVAPSMRDGGALEWLGTAFDPIPHTVDVRHIGRRGGRYNIPNIGIFLWRIDAHRLRRSPATPQPGDATGLRFRFSPLGNDTPLHTRPETEEEIAQLAEPINVPAPISRRMLDRGLAAYYGEGRSLAVIVDGAPWPLADTVVCDLSDDGAAWAHDAPGGTIAIDPQLGRLALADDIATPTDLRVTYHYGALGDLGGGEYPRASSFESPRGTLLTVPTAAHPTIQAALDALGGAGVVEIADNGRYRETLQIKAAADRTIELRAAEGTRPTIELVGPMTLEGATGGAVVLNGLVMTGDMLQVPAATDLRRLRLAHVTLVPGRSLAPDGGPTQSGQPSLVVEAAGLGLTIDHSIVGALRVHQRSTAAVGDSVIDAGDSVVIAYAATDVATPPVGGALEIESSTVVGETRCVRLVASNSILLGNAAVERRQEGCLRFTFAPLTSVVPQRFHCQPGTSTAAGNVPHLTTTRYGAPAYCQLADLAPDAVSRGAEDESEMGVFRSLFQPQREADLAIRLDEYLRVGLEAGVFHAT